MKIFSVEIDGYEISLEQNTKGEFIIKYGASSYTTRYYSIAVKDLGECIMHALKAEGKIIDNLED